MSHIQYFILINLLCLIIRHVNTLPWYKRVHSNRFHRRFDYEDCECGKKTIFPSSKIIGGREVFENEFPWMAGIISVIRSQVICGASIINDRYVITAAHCIIYGNYKFISKIGCPGVIFTLCDDRANYIKEHFVFYNFSKDDLKVSVGAHDVCNWDSKSTIFSVNSIFQHPKYNRDTNFADITLVKLIMRITFNRFVSPICLPKLGINAAFQDKQLSVSALGWGFSENDSLFSKECGLRVVDLTLFKRLECPTNVSTLLCAGYKESPRGTCGGDSGGPLQILDENYKYVLIGITSSGILCANVNYPDFYTDVTQMVSWILKITKRDSKYCWH